MVELYFTMRQLVANIVIKFILFGLFFIGYIKNEVGIA